MKRIEDDIDNFDLVMSRDIKKFEPLFSDLENDLGDRFPISMQNWCGIGERPYPLDFWKVYLLELHKQTVGVIGLYRLAESEIGTCWLGWFGLLRKFRNKGLGRNAIKLISQKVSEFGFEKLFVYTDTHNKAAINFYKSVGFKAIRIHDKLSERSADPNGLILEMEIIKNDRKN